MNALDKLKRQKQALQNEAASLKMMEESANESAGKDKPGKQGFLPEALQAQIDKAEKEAKDSKKKANALDADVDETKDKLDEARQAFLRKMGMRIEGYGVTGERKSSRSINERGRGEEETARFECTRRSTES